MEEVARVDFELLSVHLQSTLPGVGILLLRRQLLHIKLFLRNPQKNFPIAVVGPTERVKI